MGITSSKKEALNNMWIHFHKQRAKHNVNCRFLFTDKGTYFYKTLSKIPLTKVKVINHITPSGVAMYDNKTLIFYYGESPSCIFIENQDVANSFREFFNGLWNL